MALGISLFFQKSPLTAYTGYVTGHLLLALATSYRLARCWRCSREAAALAAVCYTLSGNVLFQWNNVPFLVGAAWFPEAVRQADQLLCQKKIRYSVGFGVVLALIILGGDPQTAFHAIIFVIISILCRWTLCGQTMFRQIFERKKQNFSKMIPCSAIFFFVFLFLLSVLIAFLLAAVQILPAWELAVHSDRSLADHQSVIYCFSVPVWRFVEFLFPNAGGWQFPQNARWFSALPADNEIWVPSFYAGILPALFAIVTVLFNFHCKNKRIFVITIVFLFFALGSLGRWCFVYPLLNCLPGYGTFRYPAKLLVIATLMFAVLAGTGFDWLRRNEKFRQWVRVLLMFYWIPVVFVLVIAVIRWDFFPAVPACPLFGTFNADVARHGLFVTAFHVAILILAGAWLLKNRCSAFRSPFLILFLVLFDVLAANAWMLTTVSPFPVSHSPLYSLLHPSFPSSFSASPPRRIYRFPVWYPPEFEKSSSTQRLAEAVFWDNASCFPRYTLPHRMSVIDVRGTLMPKDYTLIANQLRSEWVYGKPGIFEQHLAKLGVQYVVTPNNVKLDAERIHFFESKPESESNILFWKIPHPVTRDYLLFEPNRLILEVLTDEPQTVVLPEQYWVGWRAFLENGTEIPVHQSEQIFRAVDLPAGKHRLTMIYDPPLVKFGAVLSLTGIALSLLLIIGYRKQ
jgi:hypothetical protein